MHLPDFGPFAPWVWPAFGITLFVLLLIITLAFKDRQRIRRLLRAFHEENQP